MSAAEREAIDIENAKAMIRNEAEMLGIVFDDGAVTALATTVVKNQWAPDRLTNYIVGAAENWEALKEGTIKASAQAMKELAGNYLLTVSDDSLRDYAKRMASGELSMETVQSIFKEQAKTNYSWAAGAIDQGITVRDFMLPSRDFLARELELNPNDVDLMDPKWLSMMQVKDEKGQIRAANLNEMQTAARQDPRFAKTTKASEMGSNLALMIRNVFGMQ